jgi:hypothetical protein
MIKRVLKVISIFIFICLFIPGIILQLLFSFFNWLFFGKSINEQRYNYIYKIVTNYFNYLNK